MESTFALLESPWIPCVDLGGANVELGLRDTLVQAHELGEVAAESPLVTAALHRLLLAVLHRVFGPATHQEWNDLWRAGRWDQSELDSYLDRWRDRFDLFHPQRPFYQAPDERVSPCSVAAFIHEAASGRNPTLFDHQTDSRRLELTPAGAARMLIAAQTHGLSHGCVPSKGLYFTDGPCARDIVFLLEGDTLFETLALNLLRYPSDSVIPHDARDRPAWETDDPFTPARSVPRGYLDYLTWQSRRALLIPERAGTETVVTRMTAAPGLRLAGSVLDPMKHYRPGKTAGRPALGFREDKALWRDSAALFQLRRSGRRPPRAFDWVAQLLDRGYLDVSHSRRYLALGMKTRRQDAVDFYRSDRMPLPLAYLQDEYLVQHLEDALEVAESCSRQLWGATRTLATLILSPDSDAETGRQPPREDLDALVDQWAVERRYWSRLEIPFREAMVALPQNQEQTLGIWRATLLRTAWEAFNRVTDSLGHSPAALKATVRASGQLAAGLAKVLPFPDEDASP